MRVRGRGRVAPRLCRRVRVRVRVRGRGRVAPRLCRRGAALS